MLFEYEGMCIFITSPHGLVLGVVDRHGQYIRKICSARGKCLVLGRGKEMVFRSCRLFERTYWPPWCLNLEIWCFSCQLMTDEPIALPLACARRVESLEEWSAKAKAGLEPDSSPHTIFYYCVLAKQGDSLVHIDHVMDMIGRGYQLRLTLPMHCGN